MTTDHRAHNDSHVAVRRRAVGDLDGDIFGRPIVGRPALADTVTFRYGRPMDELGVKIDEKDWTHEFRVDRIGQLLFSIKGHSVMIIDTQTKMNWSLWQAGS